MAVAAIDAVIAYMMFVTEWHWLIERHTDVGAIRRPVNRRGSPACATNQNDDADDDHPGVNIRAGREELSHEANVSSSQINRARKRAGTPAISAHIRANGRLKPLTYWIQSPSAERASRANLKPDRGAAPESTFLASAST